MFLNVLWFASIIILRYVYFGCKALLNTKVDLSAIYVWLLLLLLTIITIIYYYILSIYYVAHETITKTNTFYNKHLQKHFLPANSDRLTAFNKNNNRSIDSASITELKHHLRVDYKIAQPIFSHCEYYILCICIDGQHAFYTWTHKNKIKFNNIMCMFENVSINNMMSQDHSKNLAWVYYWIIFKEKDTKQWLH